MLLIRLLLALLCSIVHVYLYYLLYCPNCPCKNSYIPHALTGLDRNASLNFPYYMSMTQ